jgi:hypothetical protein
MITDKDPLDRAVMYGVFHIFINIAGMLAVACISAIIEYRFGKHLRLNLGSGFSGDVDEVRSLWLIFITTY